MKALFSSPASDRRCAAAGVRPVAGLSGASLLYLWREHMRSFDVMVRGRADSLLGQVHDAEDAGDNVAIDAEALDLRGRDLWMARDEGGRCWRSRRVGASDVLSNFGAKPAAHDFRVQGKMFRGLMLHGIRQIDAEGGSPGIARPVTIFYAAPLAPVDEAIWRAARFSGGWRVPCCCC